MKHLNFSVYKVAKPSFVLSSINRLSSTIKILILILISSVYHAQDKEPFLYKLAKTKFEKQQYKSALWFLDKSKSKISRSLKGEYNSLLYQVFLNKDAESFLDSCTQISNAGKYLKYAHKYGYYNDEEFIVKKEQLEDILLNNLLEAMARGLKHRPTIKLLEHRQDTLTKFLLSTYNLYVKGADKELIEPFISGLNNYILSTVDTQLSFQNNSQLMTLTGQMMIKIFESPHYLELEKVIKPFTEYCSDDITLKSMKLQGMISDSLDLLSLQELNKPYEFYYKISALNANMVPINHYKRMHTPYLYQLAKMSKNLDYDILKTDRDLFNGLQFTGEQTTIYIPIKNKSEEYKECIISYDKDILAQLMVHDLSNRLIHQKELYHEIVKWMSFLEKDSTDLCDQFKDELLVNYDRMAEFLPDYNFYHGLNYYPKFFDAINQVHITKLEEAILSENYDLASDFLLAAASNKPEKNWKDHLSWFIPHFKNKLNDFQPQNMGVELVLASHLFSYEQELISLRKMHLLQDYDSTYLTSVMTEEDVTWTGSTETCNMGTLPDFFYTKTLNRLAYFRRIGGLNDAVYYKEKYNYKAQQAALIMDANNYITHWPREHDHCFTYDGREAASKGNLYLGKWSSDCIDGYLQDFGVESVGHRRWVINPTNICFGIGSTIEADEYYDHFDHGYNCLVVMTDEDDLSTEHFYEHFPVAWPMNGYFPVEHTGSMAWSFSLLNSNLSHADVTLYQKGKKLKIEMEEYEERMGSESISWHVESYVSLNVPVKVTVSNVIDYAGNTKEYSYEVRLFSLESENKLVVDDIHKILKLND